MGIERKRIGRIIRRIMNIELLLSMLAFILLVSFVPGKKGENLFLFLMLFNILFWPLSIIALAYNYTSVTTLDTYRELVRKNKEDAKARKLDRRENPELYEDEPKEPSLFEVIILLLNPRFIWMLIQGIFYIVILVALLLFLIALIFS